MTKTVSITWIPNIPMNLMPNAAWCRVSEKHLFVVVTRSHVKDVHTLPFESCRSNLWKLG